MCDSKELLVSFVYDELDAAEREERSRRTCASCAECRAEVAGLRSHPACISPPGRRRSPTSGSGSCAARRRGRPWLRRAPGARSGGSLRRPSWCWRRAPRSRIVDVRYDANGFVRAHRLEPSGHERSLGRRAGGPAASTVVDWKREAEALNRRVRQLEASLCPRSRPRTRSRPTRPCSSACVKLVDESEARQQRVMAPASRS